MARNREHEHWSYLKLREEKGLNNESNSWSTDVIGPGVPAKLKFVRPVGVTCDELEQGPDWDSMRGSL
jgi:hypothetical protein